MSHKTFEYDFEDGNGKVPAYHHTNFDGSEGGIVALTAIVESKVYIGKDARIFGNASVSGNAIVFEYAKVSGNARVFGDAIIKGYSVVSGDASINKEAVISGDAVVTGNALISDKAFVYMNAKITGNAQVDGRANIRIGTVSTPIITMNNVGAKGYFTAVKCDETNNIYINIGSEFIGTLEEFEDKLEKDIEYFGKDYLYIVAMLKNKY